ncbi:MAG TPA: response regulator transcription factor, partial [Nodosilinea sp.]|nr:response regulator transcription factor [Nodosilinea sp.]
MTIAPLRLMLVDEDPVFRLGLRIWLEQSAGYQVVAEATQAGDALAILTSRAGLAADAADGPAGPGAEAQGDSPRPDLDLVILDLGLGAGRPDQLPGLRLCADIKARYPTLPVLVLSAQAEPVLEAAARQMGADGFGARSMAVADLGALIQRLAEPQVAPPPPPQTDLVGPENQPPVSRQERPDRAAPLPNALAVLRFNLRQSSVQQIEAVMAQVEAEQRRGRGSLLTEAVLAGRYRELRAARWLVRRLLATPSVTSPPLE